MRSIRRCLRARVESVNRYLAAGRQQKVVTLSFPRDLADRSARIRCRGPPTNHQLLWSSGYDMSLISYQDVTLRITSVRNLRVLGSTPSGSKSFFFFFFFLSYLLYLYLNMFTESSTLYRSSINWSALFSAVFVGVYGSYPTTSYKA